MASSWFFPLRNYQYTFSTKCLSWNSWFQLKFLQIKSSYEYSFSHIVVYFDLFYCFIFSKMFSYTSIGRVWTCKEKRFNVYGITFFKNKFIPHTNYMLLCWFFLYIISLYCYSFYCFLQSKICCKSGQTYCSYISVSVSSVIPLTCILV